MKPVLLLFFSVYIIANCQAQEIQLNSPLVATSGNSSVVKSLNISKWRIGEVHLLVLPNDDLTLSKETDWKVRSYPNPFSGRINLAFNTEEARTFFIHITDISGKKQLLDTERLVFPNQVVELNLASLASGMYLLSVRQENEQVRNVMKIQKN